jgi:hypothetical protein
MIPATNEHRYLFDTTIPPEKHGLGDTEFIAFERSFIVFEV